MQQNDNTDDCIHFLSRPSNHRQLSHAQAGNHLITWGLSSEFHGQLERDKHTILQPIHSNASSVFLTPIRMRACMEILQNG